MTLAHNNMLYTVITNVCSLKKLRMLRMHNLLRIYDYVVVYCSHMYVV